MIYTLKIEQNNTYFQAWKLKYRGKINAATGAITHFTTKITLVLLRNSLKIGLAKSESNLRIFRAVIVSLRSQFGANMWNYTQRV
jgi:hypothetical protein